jgi:TPR repeat protein
MERFYEELGIKKNMSNEKELLDKFTKGQEFCLEAHCLMNGHGIEPNTEDALLWYERSANLNEP